MSLISGRLAVFKPHPSSFRLSKISSSEDKMIGDQGDDVRGTSTEERTGLGVGQVGRGCDVTSKTFRHGCDDRHGSTAFRRPGRLTQTSL